MPRSSDRQPFEPPTPAGESLGDAIRTAIEAATAEGHSRMADDLMQALLMVSVEHGGPRKH